MTDQVAPELKYQIEARAVFEAITGKKLGYAVFCCKDGFAQHAALPFYAGEFHSVRQRLFASAEQALTAYDNAIEFDPKVGEHAAYPQQRKYVQ